MFFRTGDANPYIQVNFLKPKLISGVITQGHPDLQQWVTKFQVFTSLDGKTFAPYSSMPGSNVPRIFEGNTDNKTPHRNLFNRNVTAQYVRIYPIESNGITALRFNIL